jgi:hypothetical protein
MHIIVKKNYTIKKDLKKGLKSAKNKLIGGIKGLYGLIN